MANAYVELKKKRQKEVNDFPMFFAFNNEQFEKGMKNFGLTIEETDKIVSIGAGGYIQKSDAQRYKEMFARQDKEMQEAIAADPTGEGFILDMFVYELNNHEYGYSGEIDDALHALGLSYEKVNEDPKLRHGLKKACEKCG